MDELKQAVASAQTNMKVKEVEVEFDGDQLPQVTIDGEVLDQSKWPKISRISVEQTYYPHAEEVINQVN
jgi:hypothetical protein